MRKPDFISDHRSFRCMPVEAKALYYRLLDWADDSGNCKLSEEAVGEAGCGEGLYRLLVYGYVMLASRSDGHRRIIIPNTAEEWAKYYMMNEEARRELEQQEQY